MSEPSDATPKPRRRVRRWLFLGSVALNLFLIAFLSAGAFRHHGQEREFPRPLIGLTKFIQSTEEAEWFLEHMPGEDETALRALRMRHGDSLRRALRESRDARLAALALISRGERDAALLEPALARLGTSRNALQESYGAILLDAAQSLSDTGYRKLGGRRRHKAE